MGGGRPRAALVEKAKASIAKGSKSFAVASMLLDRTTRERTHLLYAWCRRCDDIADGQDHGGELSLDKASALDRVEAIRILTHRALDGQPTADVAFDALGQVASEVGLTRQMADDVIDGFQLDAEGWRPRSEADLMRYCYHVAGAVGVMMAQVMGVPADAEDTLDRACDLGLAFQLNNIVRDIWEDDAAGRCYIPEEWLVEADIPPGQHMKVTNRDALVAIVQRMVDMARLHDAHARIGAGHLAFRQRWAILAAANIYGEIGREVVAQGPAAWDHRVHTGSLQKLGLVGAGLVEAVSGSYPPEAEPVWTRGKLIALARKDRPAPDIRETPLPDEGVRPA
uniref:phytoene/squalene synthase family protein n=1 Tax=Erythrobacter sp. EC-HK427 TaxID=2038396 RepID=UPI001F1E748B|nr:phytoene/squalene synthase family protein [Erythrobacter sp. EC-HK427]